MAPWETAPGDAPHPASISGGTLLTAEGTANCPPVCDKRQGSFIWKILPYQQLQKFESTLVLPRKSMWGQHDGKRKVGQENHLGGLLTPPLGESDCITLRQEVVF